MTVRLFARIVGEQTLVMMEFFMCPIMIQI